MPSNDAMAGIGTLTAFLGDLNWVRVTVVISLGLVSVGATPDPDHVLVES